MGLQTKLKELGKTARFDVCGYPQVFLRHKRSERFSFIYQATGEGGRSVRLFKVLKTNQCEKNCYYCANRKDRNFSRLSFTATELADLFMKYYTDGLVEGCFLSSAINGNPDKSQEELIETLYILRKKYRYKGYIHTKILPEASKELIYEASKYSDRLSINLEVPGQNYLTEISPTKNFARLLSKLREILAFHSKKPLKSGVTTQFIVGSSGESDKIIINLASRLYQDFNLNRVYYSGFIPIEGTPLENNAPCLPNREYRLYQADFLLRKYRFTAAELPFDEKGNLPKEVDPKLAWAQLHPEFFPVEVNRASFDELIRVPGIGRISAKRILETRKESKIKTLEALRKFRAVVSKARNYLTFDGRWLPRKESSNKLQKKQLFLWEEL